MPQPPSRQCHRPPADTRSTTWKSSNSISWPARHALQRVGQPAIFVVAQSADRALGVDHHRDRSIRLRCRGNLGEVTDGVEQLGRKVNAHNATHLAAIDGHQNERLFGHEAQNSGQGRDERSRPVEFEVGLRCRHGLTVVDPADGNGRTRPSATAAVDERATGYGGLARNHAAHLEHRVGEQAVQCVGVRCGVGSVDEPLPRRGDLHIGDPGDEGQSPSARCP